MWLLFDGPRLAAYSKNSHGAPPDAIVRDLSPHVTAAVLRACERGRVTFDGADVCLDGVPWTPPADEPAFTYAQAIAAINAANLPAGLKAWMRAVSELLLDHGKVEL